MDRGTLTTWRLAARDPYTLLLASAAAVQVTLGTSSQLIVRPGWAIAAIVLFALTCVFTLLGRLRANAALQIAAPFVLLTVAACWRAADREAVNGFGALALVSVIWLGFYGTRNQVWLSIAGVLAAMIVPPLVVGDGVGGNDWRRAALTVAVAIFIGPTINSLVRRGTQAFARVSELEPVGSRLDAVLRAATGHLILACDPDGTIVEFSQGAEQMLGWSAEEMVGKHTPLVFHDPDETAARAAELGMEPGFDVYTAAARRGEIDINDWTFHTKDGRRIIVSLTVSGIRNAAGELTGFVGIGTDVTETRAGTQALDAQREIYRLLVEHLPLTTVGLFDDDLRCVTIGGHWLTKSGVTAAQLQGQRIDQFFQEADRVKGLAFYEQARSRPVEVEMDLSDGRCYEFAALPVSGPHGEPLVLSLARDITGRRQGEIERHEMVAALAVSEASFREAFEGAPIGIALTSIQDMPNERFLRVNPAFAAILGRRPEDLVGVPVADVTHPEDILLRPDLTDRATQPRLRKRFVRPSGRAVWVEVSYAVVRDKDGVPSHVVKQIQDIHTIKESERALLDALEQQRAATASLRELDRIRTDLVGTISHELRTPLTSIHGYLELLCDEPLTAPQLAMLDVALRNAERLGSLVDNLLVLVRLDSVDSGSSFHNDDVTVRDAVSAAIDTVRPTVTERNQELNVTMPAEPAVVRGDAEQLDRVLVNLLSNASKYTRAGGRIDVEVTTHLRTVSIAISDTGIGIPLDEQEHLFTRFFRASTARANSISGNGLGLAIVKSIVERHDGQVAVESNPGCGSRFTVTLPLAVQGAAVNA